MAASRETRAPARRQLDEYGRKRDFGKTSEPPPEDPPPRRRRRSRGARFVVQEHHARRLHWDLRLERDGVAVSWAVPNGIPQHPGENRKAVHTEDHPLEYLTWEGVIPAGEYGAGHMHVWDSGTYEAEKWEESKVVVVFHGERVSGRYALFRTGPGSDWLIHRMDPAEPGREPMPEHAALAQPLPGELPHGSDWVFELDWPGLRVAVFCEPGRVRLETASGEDVTERFPEVRGLARAMGARPAVFDAVLVAFGRDGRPDEERIARRLREGTASTYARRAREAPAVLALVDLLHLEGRDLTGLPWEERRARLEELGLDGAAWHVSAVHRGDGDELLAATRAQGLPGVVAKRAGSRYGAGWIAAGREAGRRVEVTDPDRVVYPAAGFTKADVAAYYERIAPALLPHLRERHEIADEPGLLRWADEGNVEIHPTLARRTEAERPTVLVLDLGPGEGASLDDCRGVALILHGMFDQLGLQSFAKTSGGGLHFYVPLNSEVTYGRTRPFARQVAELVAQREPERVTAASAEAERGDRVLIEWRHNRRRGSVLGVYSLCAGARPSVSTPVTWAEVESGPLEFGPDEVVRRLEEHGDLFAPVLTLVQELPG